MHPVKQRGGLRLTGGDSLLLIFNWSSAEGHREDWRVPVVYRIKDTGTASVSEDHTQPSHDSDLLTQAVHFCIPPDVISLLPHLCELSNFYNKLMMLL